MEETKIELQLIKFSDIQSQEVSWLWFSFISYGKLTIIQGDQGEGKTTFILNIAAKLSKGESLDSGRVGAGCYKDGSKAVDIRPDTSLFRRRHGYEPGE